MPARAALKIVPDTPVVAGVHSAECLAGAQSIIDKKGAQWLSGIACGSMVAYDGKEFHTCAAKGAVCHAHLTHTFLEGRYNYDTNRREYSPKEYVKNPFLYVLIQKRDRRATAVKAELHERYVNFLLKESPARNFLLNRDNDKETRNGGVIIDIWNLGRAGTLWISKALRAQYEEHRWEK